MKKIILAAVIVLGGCSMLSDIFPSMQNRVAALESAYTGAEHIAVAYVRLPTCTGSGLTLCKKSSVVIQIASADNAAYLAIKATRAAENETTFSAAQSAVDTFSGITSSLKTQ